MKPRYIVIATAKEILAEDGGKFDLPSDTSDKILDLHSSNISYLPILKNIDVDTSDDEFEDDPFISSSFEECLERRDAMKSMYPDIDYKILMLADISHS